jgi:hypothetical protein
VQDDLKARGHRMARGADGFRVGADIGRSTAKTNYRMIKWRSLRSPAS